MVLSYILGTCPKGYINSTLQMLLSTDAAERQYVDAARDLLRASPIDTSGDLDAQLAKLASALVSGEYAQPPPPMPADADNDDDNNQNGANSQAEIEAAIAAAKWKQHYGVAPRALRALVARGHAEFETSRQQDALEWLQHFLELVARADKKSGRLENSLPRLTKLQLEERVEWYDFCCVMYPHLHICAVCLLV